MQHYSIYFNINTTQRLNVQVDLLFLLVLTCVDHFNDHLSPQGWFQKVGGFIPLHPKCLRISEATGKIKQPENNKGPELFWELCFFPFCFFLGSAVLSVFLAICSILELEAAISTVLQHFEVRTSHFPCYLQHVGAQTFHVGWYLATRVHLGFVLVFISDWFRVGFVFYGCFCFFRVSFRVGLGLI